MKLLLKNTLFIIFFFITSGASAQENAGKISGKIIDAASGKPIEFASVVLLSPETNQTVKADQTDVSGDFSMENLPSGEFTVKVSFVGYLPFTRSVSISPSKMTFDLGSVKLTPSKAQVLQEVVVQAERSTIRLGIDRKVFSVAESLVSEGGTATDLLSNVPSVSVDIDGNVSLRGADNVRILIDGKPSAIGGGNVAQLLQSLPASAIETIELITNPSSKYDPEGQSGIINIVLKKNQKPGMNGSVALTAGTLDTYNASANASYRNHKYNLYGNYSYRTGDRKGGGFNNTRFINGNGLIFNNTDAIREGTSHSFKLGADYSANDNTTFGVSGNFNLRSNSGNEDINYLIQNIPAENGSSFRNSAETEDDNGYDVNFDFNRKLKKKGENISANFSFGQSVEDGFQNFNQNFFLPDGSPRDTIDNRRNENSEFATSYNLQVDYVLPFSEKQRLEAGFRSTIRKEEESQLSETFDRVENAYFTDPFLTNDFVLEDVVHAFYSTYQNQFTETLGFQVGLRAEQAYLNTNYIGLTSGSVKGSLDYFRLYPSVFLTQKIKDGQQLQLSYSRRVNRPRGWQINPFRDISDPNNIRQGNPNLRPEDIHAFELAYIKYWKTVTFTSSVYFRQVNDVVQFLRLPISDNSTATFTSFYNLSESRASGLELIAKADIIKGFNLTGNVNAYYSQFEGNDQFNISGRDGFNWNANITGNIQFPINLAGQFNAHYYAPRVSPQGRTHQMYGLDAGLRYDFMKNRAASLSFNIRDIFNSRSWGQYTETADFIQESERRRQGRMANLTLSYRFGKQDPGQRNKRKRVEEEQGSEEEPF